MLTEMLGKGGQVCQHAKEGQIRCPLIVRPTSEDVITGNLFQVLRALNPRWWLPDLLNEGLGATRFRHQVYRRLDFRLWQNRPPYPHELLPWNEGSTQVDVTITWENPPTTIFFELKYGADLSQRTAGDDGQSGYPSDQLIRNARVGLLECGWFHRGEMFERQARDFVLIVIGPELRHPLVRHYREPANVRDAIPHHDKLRGLPIGPFIGDLSYGQIVQVLRRNRRWFSRAERVMLDDLTDYLLFKASRVKNQVPCRQGTFHVDP
jgi:hypothetical protein